jgi:hypothetical protein
MTLSPDHVLGLTLDGAPPSLNAIPAMGAPFRAEAAKWQARIAELLRGSGPVPACPLGRVEASAVLTFPDCRRRAASNYAPVLERALADALVAVGWLSAPERFSLDAPTFEQGETIATTVDLRGWEKSRP